MTSCTYLLAYEQARKMNGTRNTKPPDQIRTGVKVTEITISLCDGVKMGCTTLSEACDLSHRQQSAPLLPGLPVSRVLQVAPLHRNDFPVSFKEKQTYNFK
jgi:hypothetical protein